jgi:hypothetical protein
MRSVALFHYGGECGTLYLARAEDEREGEQMFIAICDGTAQEIYATAQTEEETKTILWGLVSDFLKKAEAPTAEMNREELENYFGCTIINTTEKPFGFVRG